MRIGHYRTRYYSRGHDSVPQCHLHRLVLHLSNADVSQLPHHSSLTTLLLPNFPLSHPHLPLMSPPHPRRKAFTSTRGTSMASAPSFRLPPRPSPISSNQPLPLTLPLNLHYRASHSEQISRNGIGRTCSASRRSRSPLRIRRHKSPFVAS